RARFAVEERELAEDAAGVDRVGRVELDLEAPGEDDVERAVGVARAHELLAAPEAHAPALARDPLPVVRGTRAEQPPLARLRAPRRIREVRAQRTWRSAPVAGSKTKPRIASRAGSSGAARSRARPSRSAVSTSSKPPSAHTGLAPSAVSAAAKSA